MRVQDAEKQGESASGRGEAPAAPGLVERRSEPRHDCRGLKLILRERRTLGIIHLRNLSSWGASGITYMPVPNPDLDFLGNGLNLSGSHGSAELLIWSQRKKSSNDTAT